MACGCNADITLTYVAKQWIHDAMSVTARFRRAATARGGGAAYFALGDAQNSGRISINSQCLILSASLAGTWSRSSPTEMPADEATSFDDPKAGRRLHSADEESAYGDARTVAAEVAPVVLVVGPVP